MEAVMTYFKKLAQHVHQGTDNNKSLLKYLAFGQ